MSRNRAMNTLIRGAILLSVLAYSSGPLFGKDTVLLKHDDGKQDGKRSIAGAGHAVRFELPDDDKWMVNAVSIRGSRYGTARPPREDFLVTIASDDMERTQEIKKPYSLFKRGKEKWVKLEFEPVEVQGAFYVMAFFNPTQTKGVYVGIDGDSSPTHSMTVVPTLPEEEPASIEGDWMIRAFVTKETDEDAKPLLDAAARSEKSKSDETARDALILGNARSLTLKHDNGKMDKYMNIQAAVETLEFDTPKNVECYVWQVQVYASQFGAQHDSEAVNGDVYILDENRKIITRTAFPYSLATQQKEWISIPTLPTKVKGKFYVGIDSHGTKYKGLYIGYEDGNQEGLASTDEIDGDYIRPADWSEKFANMQWMIRVKVADRPVVY